ncbi:MAG: aminopeptidase P N-terminal domain-containing protein [Bryobacterales bacterium]|nr:aminopeptidase P N-terminal domain-containing protein [Bryobacterales bacterium]
MRWIVWGSILLTLLTPAAVKPDHSATDEYRSRRANLREVIADGVIILEGNTEEAGDLRTGFLQEPNFYYLTGWAEPGAILLMTPGDEVLFVPRRNPEAEKWTGRKASPDDRDIRKRTGFEKVLSTESFESQVVRYLEAAPKVYLLKGKPAAARLERLLAMRSIQDAAPAIARLRMVKSAHEQDLIRRSIDVSIHGHRAIWQRAAAGLYEYQLAATLTSVFLESGCAGPAYAHIVGSGPNATVLHYSANSRRMDWGDLLLVDAGAECGGYAADITRTIPVNGKFTSRQKEIYNIVLGAQSTAIAAARPGMTIGKTTANSLYRVAYDYIDSHGKDQQGNTLGKYFTHGVSHHVGLEVHDANDPAMPLAPGMIITVEPGIYLPEENIGVRIEDMILITENGAKVLTESLPKDVEAIERFLAERKPYAPSR